MHRLDLKSETKLTTIIAGDAFVRELDVSRITLRLMEKQDKKGGDEAGEHTIARLEGDTLSTLQRCLVGTDLRSTLRSELILSSINQLN